MSSCLHIVLASIKIVVDSQEHKFFRIDMATDDKNEAHEELIKHLASLTKQEAASEIQIEYAFLASN